MAELAINERIWEITCDGMAVRHMFDALGSETFDVSQVVEIDLEGNLRQLTENDEITFSLIMDGKNDHG